MWWAHPGFTRINIELTILTNGIEEFLKLTFMSIFVEYFAACPSGACFRESPKISVNLTTYRPWWAHIEKAVSVGRA